MEFRLLSKEDIEVKVKQITEKGAIALLYKTARTDMAILDETVGMFNWETDYKEIKENLYCGIGIRKDETSQYVWKWDCGIESRTDEDGNEKKGEASDAFKRAGFKWGIGRELYTAPFIFLKVETELDGKKYKLKNKFQSFSVKEIEYDQARNIKALVIVDEKNNVVYSTKKGEDKPKILPTSPASEKVEQIDANPLTYATALNLGFYNKAGEWITLKQLDAIELGRLIKTTNPEYERLREGAKLILEFKANTEGAEQDA